MKALQRKFLFVSVALHGLLLIVLLVGPAFMRKSTPPPVNLPVLHVIPSELIDAQAYGGGNPDVVEPPKQSPEPTPVEKPPERQPERTPVTQPKTTPKLEARPVRTPEVRPPTTPKPVPKPTKPEIKVSTDLETRKPVSSSTPEAEQPQPRVNTDRIMSKVQSAARNLEQSLSSSTSINIPGPGGNAFANYAQAVKSIYDGNWREPAKMSGSNASVLVEVVIHRDGRVLSDRILRRSGNREVDRSVETVLDRVRVGRLLPKFPSASKDSQRKFVIEFNLKTRRLQG